MKFIPCDKDAWSEAEKKAKRKIKVRAAKPKKRGYPQNNTRNLYKK